MSENPISQLIKTAGTLFIGAVGIGIVYSQMVDHNMALPDALDAERRELTTPETGRLSYYVDASGEGRPLVLIHSINAAASTYEMKPLFDAYRSQRPVYVLDLPGFGFSERTNRRYSPELYTAAITTFLTQVVGEPADVVALSLGSEFAAMAALALPDQVTTLTLISPTGLNATMPEIPEQTLYNIFSFRLWSQPLFDLVGSRASVRLFLGRNFAGDAADDMIEYAHVTAHQPGARYAPLYFLSGQLFTNDVRTSVYNILTVPTLVLYDRDPNVSFDKLPDVLATNDQWQATRIADTLGLPHWEKLEETTTALNTFWAANAE